MGIFSQVDNRKKTVQSEEVIVNDFTRRIPYWSYRAPNYKIYEPLLEYREEIDGYLEKLLGGEIDDGNDNTLDNMIMGIGKQAEKLLEHQRVEHKDIIKSFDIRAKSDRKAFESQLALLKEQLAENKKEQEKYGERICENEFIGERR